VLLIATHLGLLLNKCSKFGCDTFSGFRVMLRNDVIKNVLNCFHGNTKMIDNRMILIYTQHSFENYFSVVIETGI